jgi:hypothetical protein
MTALIDPTMVLPRVPTPHSPRRGRDPAHELYEHAAQLLTSARALEAAADASGSVAAVAPTLTCVQTSLVALAGAVERLRGHALDRLTNPVLEVEDLRPLRADIASRLDRLSGVLEQGAVVAGRTRDSIEPALVELTAV